ncbi:MAG: hypothetical protein ACR2K5_16220 [Pseudolabrys sp.]
MTESRGHAVLQKERVMNSRHEPSVDALRQNSERTRAALTVTVEKLRDKVGDTSAELKTAFSPAHIKNEIRTYVRDERDNIVQSLKRRAQNNPLQAAAVGAALAYPAWGLLRAVPAPLLMIGAGLWLTSSRGKRAMNQAKAKAAQAYDQGAATVADTYEQGLQKVSNYAATVKSEGTERARQVRDSSGDMLNSLSSLAADAARKADATIDGIRKSVTSGASAAFDAASAQTGNIPNRLTEITGSAAHNATDVRDRAYATAQTSGTALVDFVDKNPLLVAGIAAALGAFIASSLPVSDAENRVFSKPSEKLKGTAREAAAQGFTAAKGMAADVAGEVTAEAARQAVNSETLKKATEAVIEGVKAVAQRGMKTALEGVAPKTESEPPSPNNENGAAHDQR